MASVSESKPEDRGRALLVIFYYLGVMFLTIFVLSPKVRDVLFSRGLRWVHLLTFSFLVSYLVTPLVRLSAAKIGVLDVPNARKIHGKPTPLLGGLAVYAAFASTILNNFDFSIELKGVAIGATMVLFVGLVDDVVGLSAKIKLLAQVMASLVMVIFGVTFEFVSPSTWGSVVEVIITVFWMVGITNAMNFFDGMDGLAAGLAAVSSLFIGIVAIQTNQAFLMFLALSLLGSCLGFLPYNFRLRGGATIFLGDTGSSFLGFVLAGMAVMGNWADNDPIKAFSVPILILGVLIFDMIYTTVERILTRKVSNFREWLDYTGKDHLHHRLNGLGMTRRQSVLLIYLFGCGLGLSAIVLKDGRTIDALLLILQAIVVGLIVVILMLVGYRNVPNGDRVGEKGTAGHGGMGAREHGGEETGG